jgi:CO/xanthine dehydrogenase Mo-binding subunit
VIEALLAERVSQCGCCQPGQITAAAELLADRPSPTDTDIDQAMSAVVNSKSTLRSAWRRPLREAAAATRERLIAAAADGWALRRKDCRAERGTVLHVPAGRRFGYGGLAARAAAVPAPRSVRLKQPRDFHVMAHRSHGSTWQTM